MTADSHKEFRIGIWVVDSMLREEDSTPANPKYGIHVLWAERLFKLPVAYSISNPPDGSSFRHRAILGRAQLDHGRRQHQSPRAFNRASFASA